MEIKSSNYAEAFRKFANWIESYEKRVNSACHCCPQQTSTPLQHTAQQQSNGASPLINKTTTTTTTNTNTNTNTTTAAATTTTITPTTTAATTTTISTTVNTLTNSTTPNHNHYHQAHYTQTWKHVILYHQNLQNEVEDLGKQLNCELKRHLNDEKSPNQSQIDQSLELEGRWHKLWLKSLEQLVIVERTRRCPKHNSTIIGKSSAPTPANKSVSKPQRRRPISYPNNVSERLEWDYQHTLSLTGSHKENGSQIDLDSVDEQVTKNLTEFGENYELWFGKEDEIACVALHSRPPSVEPDEQPEIAKAVVTSNSNMPDDINCNLLMLTTPSPMFSVDASKCPHKQKQSNFWRIAGPFLLAVAFVAFSALYHEPHHMHKSYYHTQPPV
jgi:hypothetical protein